MNPESESFLKEVRDFYWQYLQDYAKREDASIEYINEGIDLLERLEVSRVVLCEGEPPKEADSSKRTNVGKGKFWDFSPGPNFANYLDFLQSQRSPRAGHRND